MHNNHIKSEDNRLNLQRLDSEEQGLSVLRDAIEEGEASGYLDDFDFDAHLLALKSK